MCVKHTAEAGNRIYILQWNTLYESPFSNSNKTFRLAGIYDVICILREDGNNLVWTGGGPGICHWQIVMKVRMLVKQSVLNVKGRLNDNSVFNQCPCDDKILSAIELFFFVRRFLFTAIKKAIVWFS